MSEKVYGLALGWWAARGFVHIWVIKYLQEKNIKIWEIAGTSMWAIIWALYASWKDYKEIFEFCKWLENYKKLVDLDLRFGIMKWNKFLKKLNNYYGDLKIEDLPIKLKIVATDLENMEMKVFEKWRLADLVRASISLPGFFKPHKVDWKFYIDGMVFKNLPVDELTLENKIWVSAIQVKTWKLQVKKKVLWFEVKRGFFALNFDIFSRVTTAFTLQNEKKSIKNTTWNLQLLKFEFWKLDFIDFHELEKFIEIWYNQAKKTLKF